MYLKFSRNLLSVSRVILKRFKVDTRLNWYIKSFDKIWKCKSSFQYIMFIDKSNYRSNELIAQEFIEGQEYTVSVVCWRDGIVKAIVPKEIISKIGVTRIAVTRKNKKIEKICKDIQKKFKANGPFNVQLIIDKETLEPYPFEINPRFSTSITLTLAAGIDELGGLVTQALYGEKSFNFPKNWKEGVVLIRRTLDTFVDEKTFIKYPLQICND